MMKTLTAIGICAAIVFAPLAAIAQTDAAPAGAAPAASDAMAPAKDTMMKKKHMAKKHMAKKMKKPMEDAAPAAPADAPKS